MTTSQQSNTVLLEVDDLYKHYGPVKAVDGVSFQLKPGELVGLIGPNGAGKSTTFRCLVGLQRPDSGTVTIAGIDVHQDRVGALRQIGYVGQDASIYQYLTGYEVLRMVGELREIPDETLEPRITDLLTRFSLVEASKRLVHHYSGGMKRKLAIAAAILHRPKVVLFDESFAGLDPESTDTIRQLLDELRAEGSAVLLTSHVLDLLERWVSRVVILAEGRVTTNIDRSELDQVLEGEHTSLTALYLSKTRATSAG